jgi:hypothetical protein
MVGATTVDSWTAGRLQLFHGGEWGDVCGGLFGGPDATVACRQLGFNASLPNGARDSSYGKAGHVPNPKFGFSGCTGAEEKLVDCHVDADAQEMWTYSWSMYGCDYGGGGQVLACAAPCLGPECGLVLKNPRYFRTEYGGNS